MTTIHRPWPSYTRVGDREVHLHTVGQGPPLVVLHPSPGSSTAMLDLASRLDGWQVVALDTPGCGRSDPLAISDPDIADYAQATFEALDALGLVRFHLLGSHTGAKIALSMANLQPERISGLVLDGLGVSTPAERTEQLARYTPRHQPRPDGAHLVAVWHQIRDMALFWPWYAHDAAHRMVTTPPPASDVHDTVVDVLRNLEHYHLTYRAAFRHDPLPDLATVRIPTLVLAAADDPLHQNLSRIPAVGDHVTIDDAGVARAPRILAWLRDRRVDASWEETTPSAPDSGRWRTYLRGDHGAVHVTVHASRSPTTRPLVGLHPSPGSARSLDPLARQLPHRDVVLPDLPGLGGSEAPHLGHVEIPELASCLASVIAPFVDEPADLYGTHTGAAIALEWTLPSRFPASSALLDGLLMGVSEEFRSELIADYAHPLEPDPHGLHVLDAWHRVRDMMLFWPWYRQTANGVRSHGVDPHPEVLQPLVTDLLGAATTHHEVYRAAFRYRAEHAMADVTVPTVVSAELGDPLALGLDPLVKTPEHVTIRPDALAGGQADRLVVLDALARVSNE